MIATTTFFSPQQLSQVAEAALVSEELVNNYFKLSSAQWLKNRYDIKTACELDRHERVEGPLAQVIKYEARKNQALFGSQSYNFYKVCLQDDAILATACRKDLKLDPLLVYILTHELVHVVRFSMYKHRYENSGEADLALDEERKVHRLTYDILRSFSMDGMRQLFEFYKDWILIAPSETGIKNLDKLS